MGTSRIALMTASLCVFLGPAIASAQSARTVECSFVDPMSLASSAFDGMVEEQQKIFRNAPVHVAWRRLGDSRVEVHEELSVTLLDRPKGSASRLTLGGAVAGTHQLSAWIYRDSIAELLKLDVAHLDKWTRRDRADFDRAFGRVVAHELVHLLCPGLHHSPTGLMRSNVRREDLIFGSASLDGRGRNALQSWATIGTAALQASRSEAVGSVAW
jgi:hypothetical protein